MMQFLLQAVILHSDVRSTDGNYTYRGEHGVVYTMVKSLCRAPETNITWYVSCTSIHILKLKLPLAIRFIIERWVVLYALSLPQPHIYSGLLRHVTVPHIWAPPFILCDICDGTTVHLPGKPSRCAGPSPRTNTAAASTPEHGWRSGHTLLLPVRCEPGCDAPFYLSLRGQVSTRGSAFGCRAHS